MFRLRLKIFLVSLLLSTCLFAQAGVETSVEKGMAIETEGDEVAYKSSISGLSKFVASVIDDTSFLKDIAAYKEKGSSQKVLARRILSSIANIFKDVDHQADKVPNTLSENINDKNGKFIFDCDSTSLIYIYVIERMFKANENPVVLLLGQNYPHALIRWKFDDGTYINWETTAGIESTRKANEVYKDDCLEVAPDSDAFYAVFYGHLGSLKWDLKKFEDAIKAFTKAIELNPHPFFYINRGGIKKELRNFKGAIEDYTKAIELNPQYILAYLKRARVRSELGDLKGAIEDYTKAIELSPNDFDLYDSRGNAKFNSGDLKGAIEDYTKAIKLNPNDVDYNNRGYAKIQLKDYKGAIDDINKAIKLNPHYAFAYYYRGYAKSYSGDHEGAKEDYDISIKLDPELMGYPNYTKVNK